LGKTNRKEERLIEEITIMIKTMKMREIINLALTRKERRKSWFSLINREKKL
jgi:hypothetical protein